MNGPFEILPDPADEAPEEGMTLGQALGPDEGGWFERPSGATAGTSFRSPRACAPARK